MDEILPLPVPATWKQINRCKPPNPVYTPPESLDFIKQKDKDANIDFDIDVLSKRRGRRGHSLVRESRAVRGNDGGRGSGAARGNSGGRGSGAGRGRIGGHSGRG